MTIERCNLVEPPDCLQPGAPENYTLCPDLYGSAWAAAQRDYLIGRINPGEYIDRRSMAERVLVESGEWGAILQRVSTGDALADELQLVLWSAQPSQPELHVQKPSSIHQAIGRTGITRIPPMDLLRDSTSDDAWRALHGYVLHNPKYATHFNPPSGHLLAIGQVELMRGMGVLSSLDITRPNPLVPIMAKQLQKYMGLAKLSGEYAALPHEVWWTAKALDQYLQDRAAYVRGNTSVLHAHGRLWRSLFEPGEMRKYETIKGLRTAEKAQADLRFRESFAFTPARLNNWIGHLVELTELPPPEGSDPLRHSVHVAEMLGAAWAAATLRKHEPGVRMIILQWHKSIQQLLEPYVLDGLPLIARRKEAQWLSVVALESWYDNDDMVSVFTPAYGTEADDYRDAGEAMSENLRVRYKQPATNPDGTRSNGYHPRAPQLGIAMAYHQLRDLARSSPSPSQAMVDCMLTRFLATVADIPRREYRRTVITLPKIVQDAINDPDVLGDLIYVRPTPTFSPRCTEAAEGTRVLAPSRTVGRAAWRKAGKGRPSIASKDGIC